MIPKTVLAIPCKHPAAKDGVFYCEPSYINVAHMQNDFEYVLLDTKKVIAHLRERNPELLQHAEYKFRGETAESWLESMSPQHPLDMGQWGYEFGVLSMQAGQASMLKLVQELNLPCFPIAISKGYGEDVRTDLRVFLGYRDHDLDYFLDARSIKKRQIAAAQEVLNAQPRNPGGPISLATYDPDWNAKRDIISMQLDAENVKPYDERNRSKIDELTEAFQELFYAQFATTADYVRWIEERAQDLLSWNGISNVKIPTFPVDRTIDDIAKLFNLFSDRIKKLKTIESHQAPIDYPSIGQPFSVELGTDETRTIETISSEYAFPTFNEIGNISGQEIRRAPYSYVCEIKNGQINVCFLQFGEDGGPSPINSIERLATQVYNEKFGTKNIASGTKYVRPENVTFYIYLPPTSRREELIKVDLTWENSQLEYADPEWNRLGSVPYVLRKLAAAEGLAKDPDAPSSPKGEPHSGIEGSPNP